MSTPLLLPHLVNFENKALSVLEEMLGRYIDSRQQSAEGRKFEERKDCDEHDCRKVTIKEKYGVFRLFRTCYDAKWGSETFVHCLSSIFRGLVRGN